MQILPTGDSTTDTVYDKHLNACVMNADSVAASLSILSLLKTRNIIFSIQTKGYTIGDTSTISKASFSCNYKGRANRKNDRIPQEIKTRGLRFFGA
jgi:hypothetical protein